MKHWLLCLQIAGLPATGFADTAELPFGDDDGCREGPLAQFGQYLGDWQIEDSSLSRDTGQWEAGPGARWIFTCLGNGAAIQDFWLPVGGTVGTNLRTYNETTKSWDIAWAIKGAPGLSNITAAQGDDGQIVMTYKDPLPEPLRRITFFPADESGWHWKMELMFGDPGAWTEVYRIAATPFKP